MYQMAPGGALNLNGFGILYRRSSTSGIAVVIVGAAVRDRVVIVIRPTAAGADPNFSCHQLPLRRVGRNGTVIPGTISTGSYQPLFHGPPPSSRFHGKLSQVTFWSHCLLSSLALVSSPCSSRFVLSFPSPYQRCPMSLPVPLPLPSTVYIADMIIPHPSMRVTIDLNLSRVVDRLPDRQFLFALYTRPTRHTFSRNPPIKVVL